VSLLKDHCRFIMIHFASSKTERFNCLYSWAIDSLPTY